MFSYSHLSAQLIPRKYESLKEIACARLMDAHSVALTCDGWTSRRTQSYITITAHFFSKNTEDWKLYSLVLQTREHEESHTATNIAEVINTAKEEWKLEQISAVVTDNAPNMRNAVEDIGCYQVFCSAHTLQLCVHK